MELSDIITIIISVIALLISVISGVFTYRQNYYVNQYEFNSKEKTKEDILKLIACLHLMVDKTLYNQMINVEIDIKKEKEIIYDFLLSDTWIAIKYVMMKKEEDIILTTHRFLTIIYNSKISNISNIGDLALILEKQLSKMCEENLKDILKEKRKLSGNLERFAQENKFNSECYEKRFKLKNESMRRNLERLMYLKNEKGVQDYNIDLWIGFLNQDTGIVEMAIKNGADPDITIRQLWDKYEDY